MRREWKRDATKSTSSFTSMVESSVAKECQTAPDTRRILLLFDHFLYPAYCTHSCLGRGGAPGWVEDKILTSKCIRRNWYSKWRARQLSRPLLAFHFHTTFS